MFVVIFTLNIYSTIEQILSYNKDNEVFQEYWIEHQKFNQLKPNDLQSVIFNMAILPPANLGMMFPEIKQFVGVSAIDQNSIKYLFKKINFGIFIGIIFSLLALILSFHTIAGEREEGMLKLVDSYPVKRAKIITGKWLGIVTTIGLLYSACYVVTVLLIVVYANIQIESVDVISLFLIYFIGIVYISGIVLLGIYISIKVRHSYLSLLISLLVWALVVLVFPSIPDYAGRLIKVPSSLQMFYSEIGDGAKKSVKIKEIKEKYKKNGIAEDSKEAQMEIEKAIIQISRQNSIKQKFEDGALKRLGLSMGLSFLSPYASYTLAANEVAATGVSVNILLMKQREGYRKRLRDYLKQIKERSRNDPQYKPDYSDIPKFVFKNPPVLVRLAAAGVPFMLLLIFNISFFIMSLRSFRKYDVR
ncbi:hypothetical protein MNBD_BACTEROID01-835 [hydrothermal vent metagenome]|uniref:DUF3526 domain-containing protein n=1 Tax=hydrothermal vent metagenome TaxID=652676 RepID=A0A3B0U9S9_9ZZZZ